MPTETYATPDLGTLLSPPAPPNAHPAPPELTDDALLAALQARKMRALEELYDRHSHLAYGLAYRILRDTSAAEDVVQEAFLSVWRQAATFDRRRGSVRNWLLSIVHHRAIDWLRSRSNGRDDVQFALVERTLYAPDTWQTVSANVERDTIRRALAALPAEQQRTVELAYFGGYSQPEIAAAMGVPLSTVKGRMRMAMQKLRVLLENSDTWVTGLGAGSAPALTSCQPTRSGR